MAQNRLHLDFTIGDSTGRAEFISAYLGKSPNSPLIQQYAGNPKAPFPFPFNATPAELETMADYILYGKSTSSGKFNLRDKHGNDGTQSVVDAGYIEITPKNSPWGRRKEESLNSLLDVSSETGAPLEQSLNLIGGLDGKTPPRTSYRVPKEKFSRENTRAALSAVNPDGTPAPSADPFLLSRFEDLWRQIDYLEYTISTYELKIGKRKNPIRPELIERIPEQLQEEAIAYCDHINLYTWSRMRKLLVELRQQQYTWRDVYSPIMMRRGSRQADNAIAAMQFDTVLPCGLLHNNNPFLKTLFMTEIKEEHFKPAFQGHLLQFLMEKDQDMMKTGAGIFDFRIIDHVALLVYARREMEESVDENTSFEQREYISSLFKTLDYYVEVSRMEPLHKEILSMKMNGKKNDEIAPHINSKYGKTYSANYISTLYRAKCCGGIAEAASAHWAIVDQLSLGKDGFKRCNQCEKLLLRDASNYVRKARASDGLSNRCKVCDKESRQLKKLGGGKTSG